MRTTFKDRKKQYRIIYEELHKDHRVKINKLSHVLCINPRSVSKRLREAFEEGYVLMPQFRKRSYSNMKEYVYFVNLNNPMNAFKQYKEDKNVVYHAMMSGFANLWLIANKEIRLSGDIIAGGLRSDYHVAYAPNHSWGQGIKIMREKVKTFDSKEYKPKGIIKTHWNETIKWDSEDEKLFREFKYNGRKKITPIMKEQLISSQKIYEFLDRVHECCTVYSWYFPETILSYDPYLFMFETEYEDFIIELFSELPTFNFFFKVSDKLFLQSNVERSSIRKIGVDMSDISQVHIPLLVDDLLRRGILKSEAHAIVEYHWGKDL